VPATTESPTTGNPTDLIFCEGWDPFTRAAVRPLPADEARARDHSGEQYAVLLLDGATPAVLVEVAWQSRACTVWHFDEQQRRVAKHELRRLYDDELVLCERVRWRYPDQRCPEFDAAAGRHTQRCSVEGLLHEVDEPDGEGGGSWHRFGAVRDGVPRHPVPPFGDRAALAALARAMAALPPVAEEPAEELRGLAISPLVPEPWQPPVPMRPGPLAALFRDGARCQLPDHSEAVLEVRRAGVLRMPTGRLVAADVDGIEAGEPFTVRAPVGDYPVELSMLRPVHQADRATVAAGRLLIRTEPVTSWELALRSSRDPRMLAGWGFFTFEITTGGVCLIDAGARPELTRVLRADQLAPVRAGRVVQVDEPEVGNLIAFPARAGAYPTWIGRTSDGQVACFLTDLLRLHDAQMLS
jgi:hypothetical protein